MSSLESAQAVDFSEMEVAALRGRFASLPRLAYLNSGSYGLLSDAVQAAIQDYVELRIRAGADWDAWVERSFALAGKMARLINAGPDEIAITASASSGINSVASAMDFSGPRNRVLVSNYEFPTSGQIWHAQAPRGAVVEHVEEDDSGRIPVGHFERAIDERTRIVALSRVCYRHGGRLSDDQVREIAAIAHRHGAYVILDVFQSLGAEALDVRDLGVDFVVGGTYKYLLGTAGIGFLYARRDRIEGLVPTVSGWFAQERIGDMNIFANDPSHTAGRFQSGTPPVLSCYASDAGIGMILDLGPEKIAARVRALAEAGYRRFRDEGFDVATPQGGHGPMIAIRASDAGAMVGKLIERDVVTSYRDGNVRAGFHFYNDESDLERLVEGLKAHRELLA